MIWLRSLAIADGSSIHQQSRQQSYLCTNIQPLLRAGKPLDLKDILHHVTIQPKLVQPLGKQIQNMAQMLLDEQF